MQSCGVNLQALWIDRLATLHTHAILIVVDAHQGGFDHFQLSFRPLLASLRQGLALQGIHSRESANALLVQMYGVTGLIPHFTGREQVFAEFQQELTKLGLFFRRHGFSLLMLAWSIFDLFSAV